MRINRAGTCIRARGLGRCGRNQGLIRAEKAGDGIIVHQTTEGPQETSDILLQLRGLIVQAANGIYTDEDRMQIRSRSQLIDEINRIASHAQFNGMNILTGQFARDTGENTVTASLWIRWAPADQRERIIGTMTAQGLKLQGTGGFRAATSSAFRTLTKRTSRSA